MKPKVFILDVDGVMTTGHFFYSQDGKVMKIFGPDDNDGLGLLNPSISKKSIQDDMGFPLELVSTIKRINWRSERYDASEVIYMGDGIFDHYVMKGVGYSIATENADKTAKSCSDYVTERSGGDRAVAEACLHIMSEFFTPYDPDLPFKGKLNCGEWA